VPLDPEYPAERLGYMLEDSGVQLVLGDARSAVLLAGSAARLLRVDELVLATQGVESPSPTLAGNNLLCLLYTSGSTGRPKGVALEQGALLRHLLTMQRFYRIDSRDRFLHFASLNFDWGTEQWLLPLISGARCVLRGEGLWSAEEALEVIEREQASLVYFPTQYACQLAAWAAAHGRTASVRSFNVAGEAFPREGFEQIQGQLRPQHIVNGYGPTETVITPSSGKPMPPPVSPAPMRPSGDRWPGAAPTCWPKAWPCRPMAWSVSCISVARPWHAATMRSHR
jgi:non-ribosomal peptide synthetase component F